MNVYPNDDPDTAAKKIAKDFHFTNGIKQVLFNLAKLKRLGNVYDLSPEVKVVEKTGDDEDVGDDVGIGRYIAASTNEQEIIPQITISERENTADNGPIDSPQGLHGPNRPPTLMTGQDDIDAAASRSEYERLSKKSREHSKAAVNGGGGNNP